MGKKTKLGKSRKDEFYKRAKELGYRSRSAFKLLEINRKFQFLQKSKVCIDLCAAPGGWCQVAQQNMPVESLIIGIDLVSIKAIHNVTTLVHDITTDKCRMEIRKQLQTWKADVVLHDGAPNVGKNWQHDAFQQCQLTLQALKLAAEFLTKGGMFVTKVFRSKDYEKLMWVFRQLFRKATATKPKASRNESAEIFVVCEKFLAPDKVDPKFFDIKFVFKDIEEDLRSTINLIHPEKIIKKAEGYADNDSHVHKLAVSAYLTAENHQDLLARSTEIFLDDDRVATHRLTTDEIRACCADIKVLGKRDIKLLQNWHKKIKAYLESLKPKAEAEEEEMEEEARSSDDEKEVGKQLKEIQDTQKKDLKKKRKKVMKEKRKLRDKMSLKMVIPGDQIQQTEDMELFDLKKIKTSEELSSAQAEEMVEDSDESDFDDDEPSGKSRKVTTSFGRHDVDDRIHSSDDEASEYDSEEEEEDDDDEDDSLENHAKTFKKLRADSNEEESNPLVVQLESKDSRLKTKTDLWFNKEIFTGIQQQEQVVPEEELSELEWEEDNEEEEEAEEEEEEEKEENVTDARRKSKKRVADVESDDSDVEEDDDDDDDDNSDDDDDLEVDLKQRSRKRGASEHAALNNSAKDGFEIVSSKPANKRVKLTPTELAVGEELIKSNKRRRELVELSYNRYTHGVEDLPVWFEQEEARHSHKQLPVTKEQVDMYKERQKAIDINPIKKVAEAAARKKKRMVKRLDKARKKAEVVTDAVDVTDKEKMKQVKEIYKKAGLLKTQKKEVAYIVAKRGVGKRVSRPPGVKGTFKVVDPRMKKDNKMKKADSKKQKQGKGKGKKAGGKGRKGAR